jgi:hypothetical protein
MRCVILTIFKITDDVNTVNHISIQNGKKVDGEMAKGLTITICHREIKVNITNFEGLYGQTEN